VKRVGVKRVGVKRVGVKRARSRGVFVERTPADAE
jgi:hypothetical protein